MLFFTKLFAILFGFQAFYPHPVIWMMRLNDEVVKELNNVTYYNNLPQDPQLWRRQTNISTSTLILTLTLTALLSQSEMRTQTLIFTSVITEIQTITNNNQIKTSTAVQAIPTLANSNAIKSAQATTLTSSMPSPTASSIPARLPVSSATSVIQRTQNTTATFAGIPTPTNIPVTSISLPTDNSQLCLC